jgi:hypothetical protein
MHDTIQLGILSSHLLPVPKNVKLKTYEAIILLLFCTSVIPYLEHVGRTQNKVMRRIFVLQREEVTGDRESCIIRSFTSLPVTLHRCHYDDQIKYGEIGWVCSIHKSWEMHWKFGLENLKARDHMEALGIGRKIILKWRVWTAFTLNKIGTRGRPLWT